MLTPVALAPKPAVPAPLGPTNHELAAVLDAMAELLVRIEEPNPYRVRAYLNAAASLRAEEEPAVVRYVEGGAKALEALDGVGLNLAAHLADYIETGRIRLYDRLMEVADPEALFRSVPGVGPDLARRLVEDLGLTSLAALERALLDGRVEALPGIGTRTVEGLRLQLNTILHRAQRLRARRVRRQMLAQRVHRWRAAQRGPLPNDSGPSDPTPAPPQPATTLAQDDTVLRIVERPALRRVA
ncbi:MAG: helix-hairpin-helix domain-containing protein [Bacteroidota bacterium]